MSSLDVSTLFRSEKLACEIEISSKIRYDILPNISKMKPKWPSQLREYVPKLKNLCKFDILTKISSFFSLFFRILSVSLEQNKVIKIRFIFDENFHDDPYHTLVGYPKITTIYPRNIWKYAPPPKRPKRVFSHKLRR